MSETPRAALDRISAAAALAAGADPGCWGWGWPTLQHLHNVEGDPDQPRAARRKAAEIIRRIEVDQTVISAIAALDAASKAEAEAERRAESARRRRTLDYWLSIARQGPARDGRYWLVVAYWRDSRGFPHHDLPGTEWVKVTAYDSSVGQYGTEYHCGPEELPTASHSVLWAEIARLAAEWPEVAADVAARRTAADAAEASRIEAAEAAARDARIVEEELASHAAWRALADRVPAVRVPPDWRNPDVGYRDYSRRPEAPVKPAPAVRLNDPWGSLDALGLTK